MSKARLGPKTVIDIGRLIETRMLIQANSGAGKSYAIRKLLEETHGKIQQVVFDVEGEFGSLREEFDYVLAGKGGDVGVDPRTAALLARKMLELGFSLITDLYELKKPARIKYVQNFLAAMVDAPKELWHPVLVVIDEAHVFAPEKGESDAAGAVIDLATRGRKRGFAVVLATQRLAKLNKDAAAECLNKLIGRTSLDIDRKRAAEELGFVSQEQSLSLRKLKPGEFFSFGPAIHDEVVSDAISAVKTTHPKAGQRIGFKRPKPTARIKTILKKLDDLPKEAEKEIQDRDALRARIAELEREARHAPAVTNKKEIEAAYLRGVKDTERKFQAISIDFRDLARAVKSKANGLLESAAHAEKRLEIGQRLEAPNIPAASKLFDKLAKGRKDFSATVTIVPPTRPTTTVVPDQAFGACERKILGFLASYPGGWFNKVQVGAMTGYRHSSGGFNNALSKLTQAGLIGRRGGNIAIAEGADVSHLVESVPHRLEDWITKLGACERAIYEHLLKDPMTAISRVQLGEVTGYSPKSGGFNNALSRLNTLGLIKRDVDGALRLNPEIQNL